LWIMAGMKTADFDYHLPPDLIAQQPAEQRDQSRMLVLDRATGKIEHSVFYDLPERLRAGDVLVVNNTRVIPARLLGRKAQTGGQVELLLIEEIAPNTWDVLMRARRRPKPGTNIAFGDGQLTAAVIKDGEMGRAVVRFECQGDFWNVLEKVGAPPLPPYIKRKGATESQRQADEQRYQTIYAREPGAVAAPTAGLHFSDNVLRALAQRGVRRAEITLHVGIGTFRPVEAEDVEKHVMEAERYCVPREAADAVCLARRESRRVVAVGTTVVRALETVADENGMIHEGGGRTSLFIRPGYKFRAVDALLTNFHLPRSTLLMLVCAFAGYEQVMRAYREAVERRYRFYSYGDCMLIL
jgi:S-adenosylmethionine:tRNA ribosyltransferase-isomerase